MEPTLKLLSCPEGHFWEAPGDSGPDALACPVCKAAAESLPLFALAGADEPLTPAEPVAPPPLRASQGLPVVAGYDVREALGRGPLGVGLYRARQVAANRTVLLKVVYAREDAGQVAWGALRGEAAALGKAAHPNLVTLYEAGERDRQLFYNAVEHVEGPTLAGALSAKPLPPKEATLLVEALARAVHSAHEKGVVHRTLKPASVLLQVLTPSRGPKSVDPPAAPPCCTVRGARFLPKITDWGLTRRPVEGDVTDAELQGEHASYLAPEQAWGRAKEIGPSCDIYALGALLYECLTGRPPFKGPTPAETLDAVQCRDPQPPARLARVPPDLDAICRRCLVKQPRRRYATALDLAADLRRYLEGRPVLARPISVAQKGSRWVRRNVGTLALLSLALAAGMTLWSLRGSHPASAPVTRPVAPQWQQELAQAQRAALEARRRAERSEASYRVLLAARALEAKDRDRARDLLDECPQDQRGWEWHQLTRQVRGEVPTIITVELPVTGLDLHNDLVAACAETDMGGRRGLAGVWRASNGEMVTPMTVRPGIVRAVAWSPDGGRLALGVDFGGGSMIELRDPDTGLRRARGNLPGTVTCLSYVPDGSHLVGANRAGDVSFLLSSAITLWSRPTGGARFGAFREGPYARAVPIGNTGERLAAVTPDGQAFLLEGGRAGPVRALTGHTDVVLCLAAHGSTGRVATGSRDGTARLWNVPGGQATVLRGHKGEVTGVAFSPDGARVATCSLDGTVRLWATSSGLELLTLTVPGTASAVAFSPDGTWLAAAHDTRITVWKGPNN